MKMFSLLFATLLLAAAVHAQQVDFSGKWILDNERSVDTGRAAFDDLRRRDYERQGLTRKVTRVLTINHKDPVVEISQRSIVEIADRTGKLVERTDNQDFSQTLNTKDVWEEAALSAWRKARWKGDKIESTVQTERELLLFDAKATAEFPKPISTGYLIRTYQLSDGGKELIVETVSRAFNKEGVHQEGKPVKWIFRKVE